MNNIVEAAESQHRAIISAQFGVILLFVLACTFSAYTRLTEPLFRGGSGRGMTMNCSRFFGIHRSGAIVALLAALFTVSVMPTAVWAVATVSPDTGRPHVTDLDFVVAAGPMRLEVRRTMLARNDLHGLLGTRWRLNWEQDLLRVGGLALLTDTLGVDTFVPAKRNNVFHNHRGEQLRFDDNGAATLTRADGTVERYDADGRLVEHADRNNNRIVLRYNEAGILENIQGPHKAELHFKTDEAGRLTTIETSTGDKVSYSYQGDLLSEAVVNDRRTRYFYDNQGALTRIEAPMSGAVEFWYDAEGRVTQRHARDGLDRFEYDDRERKVRETNSAGGVTTTQWSEDRRRKEVVDPLGRKSISEYDERGRLVRSTGPDGHATRYGYDELGRTTLVEGPDDRALRFKYHGTGDRVASAHYPDGRVEQFKYDSAGNLKSAKGLESGDIKLSYFPNGLPKEVKGPGSRVRRYTYTDAGQIASITDGLGNVESYEYDARGRFIREINPLGGATSRQYDDAGRVIQETSASGRTLRYQYDRAGRRTAVLGPDGDKTSYEYDSSGRLVEVKRGPGDTQRYEISPTGDSVSVYQGESLLEERRYDKAGQLVQLKDALGQVYSYEYDQAGRLTVEHLPGKSKLVHRYDDSGDLVATEHSVTGHTLYERDAAGRITNWTEPGGASWKYHYGKRGRLIKQDDPNGHATRFAYGAGGEVKKVTLPMGASAHYAYDSEGRLIKQRTPGAGAIKYRHDAMGNITWTADAAGHEWQYVYNKAGDITRATDALGGTITYEYDAQGRLSTKRLGDGRAIIYRYGPNGALTHIDDGAFPVIYGYDGNGHLESTRYPAIDQALHYVHDRHGRRTELEAADGYRVRYKYSALGRVTAIESAPSGQFQFSYDAADRLVALSYPNGVTGKWSYDAADRVRSLVYQDAVGKTLASWQYDYDQAGNPIEVERSNGDTSSYRYDPVGRLVEEATADQRISYSYAKSGDRSRRQDPSGAHRYTYDKAGRVLAAGPVSFGHDANGNLVTRTGPAGKTRYQFDAAGRLVAAQLPGGEEVSFRYAPSGERVARRDPTGTRYLLYDGLNLLQELSENGAMLTAYTHGPGFDWPLAMVRNGQSYYYHADAFGNVALLTDSKGKMAARYTTDAFGNLVTRQGIVDNPFIFSGREFDAALGLYYFHSRYYDPALGRFLSPDPVPGLLSDPVSLNRYVYARNAPTRYRDPMGLYEIDYPWVQQATGLNPGQVDDLVMQERAGIWQRNQGLAPGARQSPAQALAEARLNVENRLLSQGGPGSTPSRVMSRVGSDIKADYAPRPGTRVLKGGPWEPRPGQFTKIDPKPYQDPPYRGATKVRGNPRAPSGRTTIMGRTRPGPAVRASTGRVTTQVPQAGAQGGSLARGLGRGAGGLLATAGLAVNIAACLDEGNSYAWCMAELSVVVTVGGLTVLAVAGTTVGSVLASPWVMLAGGAYGVYTAGGRWSEAPAVEAEERRRRQMDAYRTLERYHAAFDDVENDIARLKALRQTAQEQMDSYVRDSDARRRQAADLQSSAGPLLIALKAATTRAGPEGDSDRRCFKAQLQRQSISTAVPLMERLGGLIDAALRGANTLAGRCPLVENPGNIRTLYEGAQQRTREMGDELSKINADAENMDNHLSVLKETHAEAVASASQTYLAIAEKKTAVEAILTTGQQADAQAFSTFASGENIRAFNGLKRRALQKVQRYANAFGMELEGETHQLMKFKMEIEALVYPADATSLVSMMRDPVIEMGLAVASIADEADTLFAELPENPFCTVESAPDLVDRADAAYTMATQQLLDNQGLPDRADTCLDQARTPGEEDTTRPSLNNVPAGITAEATSAAGAVVSYSSPTASDDVDPSPSVSCNPASGNTFALGSTTVTCVATNASGNSSDASFTVTIQDTTPPTFETLAGITAEATTASGSVGSYNLPSASDIVDPAPSVSCSPASGSTFPLGNTPVTCVATDASGNINNAGFTVTIQDTTPPTFERLASIRAEATSASGAAGSYSLPSASDIVDPAPSVSCSPASGSIFPLGSTPVTCVATDASGNSSDAGFLVTIVEALPGRPPSSTGATTSGGDACDPTDPQGGCYDPRADTSGVPEVSEEQVRQATAAGEAAQAAGQTGGAVGSASGGVREGVAPIAIDCEYTGTCPDAAETAAATPVEPGITPTSPPGWADEQPEEPGDWWDIGRRTGQPRPGAKPTSPVQPPRPTGTVQPPRPTSPAQAPRPDTRARGGMSAIEKRCITSQQRVIALQKQVKADSKNKGLLERYKAAAIEMQKACNAAQEQACGKGPNDRFGGDRKAYSECTNRIRANTPAPSPSKPAKPAPSTSKTECQRPDGTWLDTEWCQKLKQFKEHRGGMRSAPPR